jgi:hypothetical protein
MKWTTLIVSAHNPTPETKTFDFRSDWLPVPIMAKYSVEGKTVAAYLLAGPRLDISLGA